MNPAQFQALAKKHNGVSGVSIKNPQVETETPNLDPTGQPIKSKSPNPRPTYHYVFGDGTEVEAVTQDNGDVDVTDPLTAMKPDPAAQPQTPAQAETERHNRETEGAAAAREERLITSQEATARVTALREQRQQNIDSRRLSVEEANAKYDRDYKDQVEIPLKRSAEARAIEAAKRAEDQAKFEREKYANEQVTAREKETTRQREAGVKFSYDAGQDAVKQAMDLLPYMVGPTFGSEFAAGLNTLSSGGGPVNFTPGAITFDAPDYNAIAEQAAQRAHAMYSLPAPAAPAAPAPVAGAAPAAPVAAAAVPGAIPPVTPANRDIYYR